MANSTNLYPNARSSTPTSVQLPKVPGGDPGASTVRPPTPLSPATGPVGRPPAPASATPGGVGRPLPIVRPVQPVAPTSTNPAGGASAGKRYGIPERPPVPTPGAPAAPAAPAGPSTATPPQTAQVPGAAPGTGYSVKLDRVPTASEMLDYPGATIETPFGTMGPDGRLTLSPEGKQSYQEAVAAQRVRFGPHPFAGMPNMPEVPVELGRPMFNPATNTWSGRPAGWGRMAH